MLKNDEVLAQSKGAYAQWGETWRSHAKRNGELAKKRGTPNMRMYGHGVGMNAICVGFGASLEDHLDDLRNKTKAFEILCVDKAMGYLFDNDIAPDFVYVADAGVSYEKFCEPYLDKIKEHGTCLVANVTSNPEWGEGWPEDNKIFYYVNEDNIQSQLEYGPISGVTEMVKAASNVGNSVIVHSSTFQCYDGFYLIGYDYSWQWKGNYYCGNNTGGDKRWYMNHHQVITPQGEMCSTSANLLFSARWLQDFVQVELLPKGRMIFNATKVGILNAPQVELSKVYEVIKRREPSNEEMNHIIDRRSQRIMTNTPEAMNEALQNKNILDVAIRYVPEDLFMEVTNATD